MTNEEPRLDAAGRKRLSHAMSSLLRHRAGQVGLAMEPSGWVQIDDLCRHLQAPRSAVEAVVVDNDKSRFQLEGDRIRASQGHSLAGMPVTQEALEASWSSYDGVGSVWHGTRVDVVERIAASGIVRGERSHVHLAESPHSLVGKRHQVAVLLEISLDALGQAGHAVFCSPNGVVLARFVPPACIVGATFLSRRARAQADALRALLGLGEPRGA